MKIPTSIELFLLRPTFILFLIFLLPYYLAVSLVAYLPLPGIFSYPTNLGGLFIVLVGIFLDVYSVKSFLDAKGTPMPWKPPKVLLTTGPFRYTRNHIYLSWLLMMSGFAVFINLSTMFIIIPIFMLAVHFAVVRSEERNLEKRFGKRYLEYKKKVPRWIPKL